MTKVELIRKLKDIKDMGYIETKKKGSRGVGNTLEILLGIPESNIAIPDIGARIEVKATRRNSNSLITLFTFNKGIWLLPQKNIVLTYGYTDTEGRKALKNTLFYNRPITQGLQIVLDENNNIVKIVDNSRNLIGSYDLYLIITKFISKLPRVLFCIADSKIINDKEYFHYQETYLLSDTNPRKFIEAFKNGLVGIDLRMHLKANGAVRNRGTAFRMKEINIKDLYENIEELL